MTHRVVVVGVKSKEEDFVTAKILRKHYGSAGCPRYSDRDFAALWSREYVTLVTASGDMWHSHKDFLDKSLLVISYAELIELYGESIKVRKELTT